MNGPSITLLIAVLISLSGCATGTDTHAVRFLVAEKTIALDKRPWYGKGNLFPWESPRQVASDGTITQIVSNSCGLVDLTYETSTAGEYLRRAESSSRAVTVVRTMGEWCDVTHLIVDLPTLLYVRNWRGRLYVEGSAPIVSDEHDQPLIVDAQLIEDANLTSLAVALGRDPKSQTCFPHSELTPEAREELQEEGPLVDTETGACFERGVYLKDLQQ